MCCRCGDYASNVVDVLIRKTYQRKVDVDMLNAVKSVLSDVSSVSPLSVCCDLYNVALCVSLRFSLPAFSFLTLSYYIVIS